MRPISSRTVSATGALLQPAAAPAAAGGHRAHGRPRLHDGGPPGCRLRWPASPADGPRRRLRSRRREVGARLRGSSRRSTATAFVDVVGEPGARQAEPENEACPGTSRRRPLPASSGVGLAGAGSAPRRDGPVGRTPVVGLRHVCAPGGPSDASGGGRPLRRAPSRDAVPSAARTCHGARRRRRRPKADRRRRASPAEHARDGLRHAGSAGGGLLRRQGDRRLRWRVSSSRPSR